MAKRKKAQPWDAVFDRIRCVWYPGKAYQPKTTAAELDAVETELGFKFPLSYRAFAERFGLGGELEVAPRYGIHVTLLPLVRAERASTLWPTVAVHTRRVRREHHADDNLPLINRRSRPHPSPTTSGGSEISANSKPTTEFGNLVAFAILLKYWERFYQPSKSRMRNTTNADLASMTFGCFVVADSFWEWLSGWR